MNPRINDPKKKKINRSTWLPALLLIYLFGMTLWFAPSLIAGGEIARLIIVFVTELIIIIILRKFLQKRERQQNN